MLKIIFFNPNGSGDPFVEAMRAFPEVEIKIAPDEDGLGKVLPGAEILIIPNRIYTAGPAEIIRTRGTSLKWIAFITTGYDKAVRNGLPANVTVTNMAGVRAVCVAEHSVFLMLSLVRQSRAIEKAQSARLWARDELSPGMDNLAGKHLVIVGAGAIARNIAKKMSAFDMRITGVSRSTERPPHFHAMAPREELAAIAAQADILLVAALADESTEKIISGDVIGAMQPHAYLVNIARGSLVDEPALITALKSNKIAGAALEVQETEPVPPDHPLWDLDNVIITPHVGGAGSPAAGLKHADIFSENLKRWLAGVTLDKIVIECTP